MANWCCNEVIFEGEYLLILQIKELFKIMAENEEKEQRGQLPDWVKADEGYFFDICWNVSDKLTYKTKYRPNIDRLAEIANEYDCHFECKYEELGDGRYGKATYIEGILEHIYLEAKDFAQFHFDENTDQYHFEGGTYESESDILEMMLERKIAGSINNNQNLPS
ncbi:hypothetical protein J7E50_18245 [Pedobacter sp. ISL-68]|uniref:DUF1281 family ferredoxin-like fold protein n=1 Tax=unclassified Pedobacter TaxID=2628915 RepID=UPI001BE87AD8|nr:MULTISPECIES: hypothetical protein [unclassified Pedobacter]MBT2559864.1 hypothetical protein [Pedobacter sp. ISL-64]MBT2592169.1 hypothetical protein [Pedobacter sp. ISL-68]